MERISVESRALRLQLEQNKLQTNSLLERSVKNPLSSHQHRGGKMGEGVGSGEWQDISSSRLFWRHAGSGPSLLVVVGVFSGSCSSLMGEK